MLLALRTTPARSATAWQRVFAALTRWRLVSRYTHGGVIVHGRLLHVTASGGLHEAESYDPARWDVIDVGGDDAAALALFERLRGARYNFFGLLAFVLPWRVGSARRLYCFEWCCLAMGLPLGKRSTPEQLLRAALARGAAAGQGG